MKSIFASILFASLMLPHESRGLDAAKLYWYHYTLDSTGDMRGHAALKYDKEGNIKIAYRIKYDVNYGVFDGEFWRTQQADTSIGGDAKVAMTLDHKGNPHIAAHNWRNSEIRYSRLDDSGWNHQQILTHDPSLDFYQISMATDPKDRVHLTFTSKTHHPISALTYSMVDGEGMLTAPVFACTAGFNGKWNKLTTDKEGNPVAAFFLFEGSNLDIAYTKDGEWTHQVVDSSRGTNEKGFHVDIKPDTGNLYKVAYYDRTHKAIEMASGTPGGEWTMEKVDTMPAYTLFSTLNPLSVDTSGNVFIAYTRVTVADGGSPVTSSSLRLAIKSEDQWTDTVLDSIGIVGEYATMDLGPEGLPAIAYYERGNGHFRLAVASLTPPPDADKNGIPDYTERSIFVSLRARHHQGLKNSNGRAFDLRGRRHMRKVGSAKGLRSGVKDLSQGQPLFMAP